jgi:hypothetical protein
MTPSGWRCATAAIVQEAEATKDQSLIGSAADTPSRRGLRAYRRLAALPRVVFRRATGGRRVGETMCANRGPIGSDIRSADTRITTEATDAAEEQGYRNGDQEPDGQDIDNQCLAAIYASRAGSAPAWKHP